MPLESCIQIRLQDPFRAADMAIEIQVEKMRVAEATSARDSAVQRLASAYDSIKEKAIAVGRLQTENAELERRLAETEAKVTKAVEDARGVERTLAEDEIMRMTEMVATLNSEMVKLKEEKCVAKGVKSEDDCAGALIPSADASSSSLATAVDSADHSERASFLL